jgi:hypothetical protein
MVIIIERAEVVRQIKKIKEERISVEEKFKRIIETVNTLCRDKVFIDVKNDDIIAVQYTVDVNTLYAVLKNQFIIEIEFKEYSILITIRPMITTSVYTPTTFVRD